MKNETISKTQGMALILLFMMGTSLIIGTGLKAGKDAWLVVLISTFISLPLIILYYKILLYFPGKNLYEILEIIFGKIIGKAIICLYILYSLHLSSILLATVADFIKTVGLFSTPRFFPIIFFSLLSIWALKEGIETLGRWSKISFIILFFTVFITTVLLIHQMRIEHFTPVLHDNIDKLPIAIYSTVILPFSQLFFFTIAFDNIDKKENYSKIFIYSSLIGGLILTATVAIFISIISESKLISNYFTAYETIRLLDIKTFIERIEIVVTLSFLLGVFIKVTISELVACKGIAKLFNCEDYRFIVVPVVLLTYNISLILYESVMETTEFTIEIYPYYAFPFQILLPIIIFTGCKIKSRFSH